MKMFNVPPSTFDPDDKRSYLLMVFTRTPFVAFAVPKGAGQLKLYPFPASPGIYALYRTKIPISTVLTVSKRTKALTKTDLRRLGQLELLYVGKTSGTGGSLRSRLGIHFRKIDSRQGLSTDEFVCRYLQIKFDWNVLFSEHNLISATEITSSSPPPWNTNGFGSNVPGEGRPGKHKKRPTHFDVLYPVKPMPPRSAKP
jgi:hypothetical protein